jgi:hypothetical protein
MPFKYMPWCSCNSPARRAVALAGQELRARPTLVARRVQADELGHPLDVVVDAVELVVVLTLGRAAVAGGHRIDEHDVGEVEPRVGVVDQCVRRRRRPALGFEVHAPRPDRAQVQPDRRRTRPAVEREQDRSLADIGDAVARVGDEENVRLALAGLGLERKASGAHGVVDLRALDRHRMVRDRVLVLGRSRLVVGLGCVGRLHCRRGRRDRFLGLRRRSGRGRVRGFGLGRFLLSGLLFSRLLLGGPLLRGRLLSGRLLSRRLLVRGRLGRNSSEREGETREKTQSARD